LAFVVGASQVRGSVAASAPAPPASIAARIRTAMTSRERGIDTGALRTLPLIAVVSPSSRAHTKRTRGDLQFSSVTGAG
jgi:hypothetical protein